jgi:hypothetical protein
MRPLCPKCFRPMVLVQGGPPYLYECLDQENCKTAEIRDVHPTTPMQDDLAEMEDNFKDSLVGSVTLIKGEF